MNRVFKKIKTIPFSTWISFFSLVTSIIMLCLTSIALGQIKIASEQLSESRKTDQGNFIVTLNRDFYANDKLTVIRKSLEEDKPLLKDNGGTFDAEDIDGYIGFFDTLSGLIDKKILDYGLIDENFGYYIKEAYDNQEIVNYVKYIEKSSGQDVYQGFKTLGLRISKEGY